MEDQSPPRPPRTRSKAHEEDTQAYNEEGLREIYQIEANIECEGDSFADDKVAPYIVHIDAWSKRVLGLYRNWPEKDELRRKKHWMVEYTFIPWRGGPGIGLAHLIGSLAASGTGAVRAILDAAHIQNFPGGAETQGRPEQRTDRAGRARRTDRDRVPAERRRHPQAGDAVPVQRARAARCSRCSSG
jgi:hypothetical protein